MEALFTPRDTGRNWRGIARSWLLALALHGAALLAALWYLAHRPVLPQADFTALPVDLVIGGALMPGSTAAPPAARLQIAPPRPEAAPSRAGVRPDGKRPAPDALAAQLARLAQAKSPDRPLPNAQASGAPDGGGTPDDGAGNYALRDYIRAQILRRWLPDLSLPGARDLPVAVRLRLSKSGVIEEVTILDQARFHTDRAFRNMALSARDAALLASPITFPAGVTPRTQMLTINLDPRSALR